MHVYFILLSHFLRIPDILLKCKKVSYHLPEIKLINLYIDILFLVSHFLTISSTFLVAKTVI